MKNLYGRDGSYGRRRGDIEGSDEWLEEFTEEDDLGKQQCCWIGCF